MRPTSTDWIIGSVLNPVRWVMLLTILASLHDRFGLEIDRPGIVGTAGVYGVVIAVLSCLRRQSFSRSTVDHLALAADLLFSAVVFSLSGGVRSPYFGLWYLVMIHTALVLGRQVSLGVALAAAVIVLADQLTRPGGREGLLGAVVVVGKLSFLPVIAGFAGRLAQDVRDREASQRQAERRTRSLVARDRCVRQEMERARRVQESLLPLTPPVPDGLTLATLHCPAREVGGDHYDLLELPDGRLLIAIADVAGKGVPAALLSVAVQQGIRQFSGPDPAAVLAAVNRLLLEHIPDDMFVTAACVVLDPCDGSVAVATAGHPPPLRWNHASWRLEFLHGQGVALGVVSEWSGRTHRCRLAPGDGLLLYTDGVVDARLNRTERLGEARLVERLGRTEPVDAQAWVDQLRRVLDGCQAWPDDMTAVAVVRAPNTDPNDMADGSAGR